MGPFVPFIYKKILVLPSISSNKLDTFEKTFNRFLVGISGDNVITAIIPVFLNTAVFSNST